VRIPRRRESFCDGQATGGKILQLWPLSELGSALQIEGDQSPAPHGKDNVMKRITAIALLAIANFAMAGTSFAQSETVQVKVPFDFTVSDQLLPSGTYSIKTVSPAILDIKNRDNSVAVLVVVNQAGTTSPHGGKLRFHKYGDQYFLNEILCDREGVNVTLPRSRIETRVRRQQATLKTSGETFVAAR
jgi:hypothetical protein